MSTPKTIVLCSNTAYAIANFRGGAIRALVAAGHRVVIVAPRDDQVEALEAMGARFVHWELSGRSTGIGTEWASLRELVRIYRQVRPDLCFHYTIKSVLYGAIAAKWTGVPFVSVITGLGYVFLNETLVSAVARAGYRLTLSWSRQIWFLNAEDRAEFLRLGLVRDSGQAVLLPGEGVDTTHFRPLPHTVHEGLVVLMVARLLRDKGVVEYVEAARRLRAQGLPIRFQLLGAIDTNNPTAIHPEQLEAWQREGVIDYLGTTRDVRPFIAACDVVALPSYREGTSRSLMEAAAMGKPLVASDVPGCRELIVPGESGLLCPARDATALAQAFRSLASLPPERLQDMGQRGRALVEAQFDERVVLARYLDLASHLQ